MEPGLGFMAVNKGCYGYYVNNNRKKLKNLHIGVKKMIGNSKLDCFKLFCYQIAQTILHKLWWLRKLAKEMI